MIMQLINGFAEWSGNDECLSLKYWYIQNGRLKQFKALCPHKLSPLQWNESIPDQHISSAIAWLKAEAIPKAEKVNYGDSETLRYSPEYRGYLSYYPIDQVDEWTNDLDELAKIILRSTTFCELIQQDFSMPSLLRDTQQAQKIKQTASDFIKSPEVQEYLKKTAEVVADFWVSQLGSIGSSGNAVADLLHAVAREDEDVVTEQDTAKLKESLISHSLKSFSNKNVPFYDTDYGVKGELEDVLKENDLMHLAKHLPWKTWKDFDFSDAPSIEEGDRT
jgi:hypothetical protein